MREERSLALGQAAGWHSEGVAQLCALPYPAEEMKEEGRMLASCVHSISKLQYSSRAPSGEGEKCGRAQGAKRAKSGKWGGGL